MLHLRLRRLFDVRLALRLLVGYFLGIFFDPVDGGSTLHRNVGELLEYMTSHPR
jgi:hypothetical protein